MPALTVVLIVDKDPIALELLRRQFDARGCTTCVALDAAMATNLIAGDCRDCAGLITNIDLDGPRNGWDLARLARELNPTVAIGYMSAEGHRDWVAYGVPNSVLLNKTIGEAEIATAFLRFCSPIPEPADHAPAVKPVPASEKAETVRLNQTMPASPFALTKKAFLSIDWSATALGASTTWDDNLRSWMRFMLTMNEPLLVLWGKDRVALFNQPFGALFENSYSDMLGKSFTPPPSDFWDRIAALFDDAFDGRSGTLSNLRLARPSGAAAGDRFFDASCASIQNSSDATVGAICLFTETTEAARAIAAMRRERDELHAFFMQTPSFIAFLEGAEHRFTFANAAYLHLVEQTDVVGQRVVDALPEVVAQGFVQILDRIYLSGEPFIAKGVEISFRMRDGSYKQTFLDFVYHPIRDVNGQITGIFVEGEDMTEHHKAQVQIGVLQNELIHVSRVNAMGTLATTIAHELRQPLTTIHNYMSAARMIVERQPHDPRVLESLQRAGEAALRAGDIIRNLKSMTTGRGVVRRPVPLGDALREAAALACVGRSGVQLNFDLASTAKVHGDRVQIQQVIFNLLQNALETSHSEVAEVVISTVDRGSFVEICVSDAGPGIAPALLPTIFDSFVTTKAEGTGIGLSICRAIVERHGGTIHARNRMEGGAIFCFTLPHAA